MAKRLQGPHEDSVDKKQRIENVESRLSMPVESMSVKSMLSIPAELLDFLQVMVGVVASFTQDNSRWDYFEAITLFFFYRYYVKHPDANASNCP